MSCLLLLSREDAGFEELQWLPTGNLITCFVVLRTSFQYFSPWIGCNKDCPFFIRRRSSLRIKVHLHFRVGSGGLSAGFRRTTALSGFNHCRFLRTGARRRACNNMGVSDAADSPWLGITPNFTFQCCAVHAGRKQRTKTTHWKTTRKRYCERHW
jgi:hypothetical protein